MRHITTSGFHVGHHEVAGMFWIVAASQSAKVPLREYRAQANHEHCQSVTSSAAPDAGSFRDNLAPDRHKGVWWPHKSKPTTECRLGGEPSKAWTASAKHRRANER
jgi:hypothetical protein